MQELPPSLQVNVMYLYQMKCQRFYHFWCVAQLLNSVDVCGGSTVIVLCCIDMDEMGRPGYII